MVPNTRRKLQDAINELDNFMEENKVDNEQEGEEWQEARNAVIEARETLADEV